MKDYRGTRFNVEVYYSGDEDEDEHEKKENEYCRYSFYTRDICKIDDANWNGNGVEIVTKDFTIGCRAKTAIEIANIVIQDYANMGIKWYIHEGKHGEVIKCKECRINFGQIDYPDEYTNIITNMYEMAPHAKINNHYYKKYKIAVTPPEDAEDKKFFPIIERMEINHYGKIQITVNKDEDEDKDEDERKKYIRHYDNEYIYQGPRPDEMMKNFITFHENITMKYICYMDGVFTVVFRGNDHDITITTKDNYGYKEDTFIAEMYNRFNQQDDVMIEDHFVDACQWKMNF